MKLTVLGCYGPYPHPNGACSGYLIECNQTKLLLDLGNGTLRNYLKSHLITELDAVILSHLHPDHCSDVFVLRYALELNNLTVPLYAPTEPEEDYNRLAYKNAFQVRPINNTTEINTNQVTVTFLKMQHAIDSYAVKIQFQGTTFVYSGDTGYTDQLIDFIKDCDLFLCEAAISDEDEQKKKFHMSALQACRLAESANCKATMLTHFFPLYQKEQYLNEISEYAVRSNVSLAEEHLSLII